MSEPAAELREAIRERILREGFDRVGFARAGRAPGADLFEEWLRRGHHASMEYLARNRRRRVDPREVLPGARTVIVAALDYRAASSYGIAAPRADRGEISCYARGEDYHRIIEPRLRRACRWIREEHAAGARWYADTGPVLEKSWAQEAGVGWIGKNTCSIDPERGSFFFLGAILTTLELPPDPPARDRCGECRLCIDACPTGAIIEPRVLDARRCISYLTIEHRGEIPPELEERIGQLVFGCDICQEVCPWNRPDRQARDPETAPREENVFPPLADLAALDREGFARRFARSAVKRARFEGLLRSAIIAAGNSGRRDFLKLLDRLGDRVDVREDPALRATLERARKRLEAL
ncbi:MAG: tRNA epoxyqueuosine(34) reductase QueG, partial [Planctomycetes bacterium]|nr:tRNA epoxyqueuosine(34) reductase QueG [Planctomycetota bacterium]